MLKIGGKLEALGELRDEDIPTQEDCASAILKRADGRQVVISGLTREECRSLAGDFGEPITLKVEGLPV